MTELPLYTTNMVHRTAQLIVERFSVAPEYAERLAVGALNGLESHGGNSTDWQSIVNTVNVVVASWIENGVDFHISEQKGSASQ